MRNVLSKREWIGIPPRVQLNAVWYVDADDTYSVNKRNGGGTGYVAIRTLTGAGRMELSGGGTAILRANSVGIYEMKRVRAYSAEREGWQFYWFEFSSDAVPPLLDRETVVSMSTQERIELEGCFQRLSRNAACECMAAESLFGYLMADWQRRGGEEKRGGMAVQDLLALLERGRQERSSVACLAHEAGMCERSFRNAVHEATGLSPKAYMLKGEMAAAMELLCTTGMTVSEIAALFNYSSPFYFSRAFRKHYGVSPRQVRDGIRL